MHQLLYGCIRRRQNQDLQLLGYFSSDGRQIASTAWARFYISRLPLKPKYAVYGRKTYPQQVRYLLIRQTPAAGAQYRPANLLRKWKSNLHPSLQIKPS
jgi:hypothetical protein